ncbi:MAG: helicase-related protein [Paracoccaceae bacterium]|nr:helicase-related protein [Paracoccaceae bacterium]
MACDKRVAAVLGPTNTGKTFLALERMLGYGSGIIGLPLRLLAREIFDKLVVLRGKDAIALITGEERIIPENPKYWVCTVEAMPSDLGVDFVAVDEIQLCADPERGYVFTDRLLNSRGRIETMFMGSDTVLAKIQNLVPDAHIIKRTRFSELTYKGTSKISRIPERSAIVSFSVSEVYAIAELIRRQKGGAAVIMGALSPRTRNAQVALYENGDVDYLVATDAIGMGLNLDIKHVAFAKLFKFDGRKERRLFPNELAQIAGRAGRYRTNGTFGVTGEAKLLEPSLFQSIEMSKFSPVKFLQWRNSKLNFGSVEFLIKSLEIAPKDANFVKAKDGTDLKALRFLSEQLNFNTTVNSSKDIKLLWEVCQIPDFRKLSESDHGNLLSNVFQFVRSGGVIPDLWLQDQIRRLDRIEGDIEVLSKRLAFIRTWTFVSYKRLWTSDCLYWQAETRRIEDKLSDELHRKLTQRFVDRRTSVLVKGLKQRETLVAEINQDSEIFVENQLIGTLVGFCFEKDKSASDEENKALKSTAHAVLGPQYKLRSDKLYNSSDEAFAWDESGRLYWHSAVVGKLEAGNDILSPKVTPLVDTEAGIDIIKNVKRRLEHFISRTIEKQFEPLLKMQADDTLAGIAKGVAFRLIEGLGLISRSKISDEVKALEQKDRGLLRKHGVRFGQFTIFHYLMLKPAPTSLRLLLWSLFTKQVYTTAPPPGLVTIPKVENVTLDYYIMGGFKLVGDRALRVDMLERLADLLRVKDVWNGFEADVDMLSITGLTLDQFSEVLQNIGYSAKKDIRPKVRLKAHQEPTGAKVQGSTRVEATQTDILLEENPIKEDEVFYTFKMQKRLKVKNKMSIQAAPKGKSKAMSKAKKSKVKNQVKWQKPMKEQQKIDPNNPFLALLELKNKL